MSRTIRDERGAVRWSAILRACLAAALFCALLLSLLDRGAVSAEARILLSFAIYSVLLISVLVFGIPRHARVPVVLACLLLVATALVVWLQTVPASPFPADPVWATAGIFMEPGKGVTTSLTPADDRFAFLSVGLPFGLFMAGLLLFDTDERALRALSILTHAGGVIALGAIVQFTLFPGTLVLEQKRNYFESLTAFFVNKNTAATFLGLVVLLYFTRFWLVMRHVRLTALWAVVVDGTGLSRDERKTVLEIAMVFIGLNTGIVALMMTKSRAGVGVTLASLLLLSVLFVRERIDLRAGDRLLQKRKGKRWVGGSYYSAPLALLFLFVFFGGEVIRRMMVGSGEEGRMCFMPDILQAVGDHLPWGAGLASFEMAYAPYGRPECGIETVLTRAHSVYLEGLLSLGVAFVPLFLGWLAALAWIFVRGIQNRVRYRYAGYLGIAALTLVLLHSVLDFSVQIPGFAASFALLLSPLVTLCRRPSRKMLAKTRRKLREDAQALPVE